MYNRELNNNHFLQKGETYATGEKSKTIDRYDELHVLCKHSGQETDPGDV